ncbi:MAG: 2-C-methyl-D-erythritol 2,4-cyclodiphosphate synthase [Dehalococcoidia bacterium]
MQQSIRIGIGFDAHPLTAGRPLVLGGVTIPFPRGLAGHSDGDVLVHALLDALLGAAGLGDKGQHFPSSDPQYEGVSSLVLLERVVELLDSAGWRVVNVDATMLAEQPALIPFIPMMRQTLGDALSIGEERVSLKATTTDGLGFVGRGEGMGAYVVALLEAKR